MSFPGKAAAFAQAAGIEPEQFWAIKRVHNHFHMSRDKYPNLSWEHFYTALEWDRAAEWLELADLKRQTPEQMLRDHLTSIACD